MLGLNPKLQQFLGNTKLGGVCLQEVVCSAHISGDSRNFFQGVPQQAQITQSNKKKILYIDNNNNKKQANT